MAEHCSFCGVSSDVRPLDKHHVHGRLIDIMEVWPVCRSGCHRILTGWQWADRVPLDKTRDEPPDEVKHHYMILAVARCLELTAYNDGSMETAAVVQSLARGFISSYNTGQRVKTWEDGNAPRGKTLNPANVPNPRLSDKNSTYIIRALAGIEAYLYEQIHGRKHATAILLRHFETDYEAARQIFEKYGTEITALHRKGLLTHPKTYRTLVTKISSAIEIELGSAA